MKKIFLLPIAMFLCTLHINAQVNIISSIESGNSKQLMSWISDGHDVNTPVEVKGVKMNILSLAAKMGNPEMVDVLLKKGANAKAKTDNVDALMYAAESGNKEVVNLLIQAGADVTLARADGMTAKDLAVNKGNKEVANILAEEMNNKIQAARMARAKKK